MDDVWPRPLFSYDPFSVEAMRNPQDFYPTLRERYPAYPLPDYDAYAFTRYDDVWKAFMDAENFSEAEGQVFSRQQLLVHHRGNPPAHQLDPVAMFNFLDPPIQSRFRRAMAPPFAKGSVAKLAADITLLVRNRLKTLIPRGRFDLNGDFGSYISVGGTCILVGLPIDETPRLIDLVNRMVARDGERPGATPDGMVARDGLMDFLRHVVARRRYGSGPPSAVIDALIGLDVVGRPLTDNEIAVDLLGILVGGTETIPKVFAGGLLELSKQPDQLAEVVADPAAAAVPLFEEMLRYNAPAQWFGRTAKQRCVVGGVTLEPGQRAILLIAAANRDPREFDDPEAFIWNRKARRMLSFGVGPHFCIGIHLARLEGQIMLREFLSAAPRFDIDPAGGNWAVSEFQIGWTRLPITVTP